ncbi:MAG: class I SAM-dependent methyltransferase, partial [Calditrichaeota bacterium]|nr:class I SAM-dependent methyltransferase [Calditrichota bacterium]
ILESEKSMSEADIHHGHQRVYDSATLREDFIKSGYQIESMGGFWIKPMADKQLEKIWDENTFNSFFKLGEYYPDIAAEIYIVAKA